MDKDFMQRCKGLLLRLKEAGREGVVLNSGQEGAAARWLALQGYVHPFSEGQRVILTIYGEHIARFVAAMEEEHVREIDDLRGRIGVVGYVLSSCRNRVLHQGTSVSFSRKDFDNLLSRLRGEGERIAWVEEGPRFHQEREQAMFEKLGEWRCLQCGASIAYVDAGPESAIYDRLGCIVGSRRERPPIVVCENDHQALWMGE